MKGDRSRTADLAMGSMEFDEARGADLLSRDIPPVPGDLTIDPSAVDKSLAEDSKTEITGLAAADQGKSDILALKPAQDNEDVLQNENIKEIIPPVKEKKKADKKTKVAAKEVKSKKTESRTAVNDRKQKEPRSKSRMYEVSADTDLSGSYDSYAVQVASYDMLSKAEKERSYLKSRSYDAYIDRANVNGRNYFRVRIGPVGSKKKACALLDEIQSDPRYSGSYMVKE